LETVGGEKLWEEKLKGEGGGNRQGKKPGQKRGAGTNGGRETDRLHRENQLGGKKKESGAERENGGWKRKRKVLNVKEAGGIGSCSVFIGAETRASKSKKKKHLMRG